MKKFWSLFVISLLLLLAGCITVQYPASAPTQAAAVVVPTQVVETVEQEVIYITATPLPATSTPIATDVPVTITITDVVDQGQGKAKVFWETTGEFPVGYAMVWSDTDTAPTFPEDQSTYIGDADKRSAEFEGDLGKIYYVRLCRYVSNSCDVYSNVGIVAMMSPTATPTKTPKATATTRWYPLPYNTAKPTATYNDNPYIYITSVQTTGAGAARVYWKAYGDFNKGFLVLYNEGTSAPTYGDYSYYKIDESYARWATVSGHFGETYTFVVCRWTGTTCDSYSKPYQYTFKGVTPTSTPGGNPPPPPHR